MAGNVFLLPYRKDKRICRTHIDSQWGGCRQIEFLRLTPQKIGRHDFPSSRPAISNANWGIITLTCDASLEKFTIIKSTSSPL